MKHSVRGIAKLARRADTILRKARELAYDINQEFGVESTVSDFADDVVCTAETLADGLQRLPAVLKNGGRP